MKVKINIKKNIFSLIVIMVLSVSLVNGIIRNLLYAFITFFSFICLVNFYKKNNFVIKKRDKIEYYTFVIGAMIFVYYFMHFLVINNSFDSLERLIQISAAISVFLVSVKYYFDNRDALLIRNSALVIVMVNFGVWILNGFKSNYFKGLYNHSNMLGSILFFCFFILDNYLPHNRVNLFGKILSLLLMYMSNNRSILISLVIYYLFKIIIKKLFEKNISYNSLYFLAVVLFVGVPIFYMMLYNSPLRGPLNEFSRQYFRKNFFSGRQYLWGEILNLILLKPFCGYGLNAIPEDFIDTAWSSHNWYLQITLQTGVIGLTLVLSLLYIIWRGFNENKNLKNFNSSSLLISVMIWQCFEVSLTQNNFASGIIAWLLFGLSLSENKIIEKNEQ